MLFYIFSGGTNKFVNKEIGTRLFFVLIIKSPVPLPRPVITYVSSSGVLVGGGG